MINLYVRVLRHHRVDLLKMVRLSLYRLLRRSIMKYGFTSEPADADRRSLGMPLHRVMSRRSPGRDFPMLGPRDNKRETSHED